MDKHSKHTAIQDGRIDKQCSWYVFDYIRLADLDQYLARVRNQVWIFFAIAAPLLSGLGIFLAWRTCVYRVKLRAMLGAVFERVGLMKLERIARHRLAVHAHYIKSSAIVAHRRAAR